MTDKSNEKSDNDPYNLMSLTHDLCEFPTGVVTPGNTGLFDRLKEELPLNVLKIPSGQEFNGWIVPQNWWVEEARITLNGLTVFDGTAHTLGVGCYSNSFEGTLSWQELEKHLVTEPRLPDAYIFHCMWQYRPWLADWAMSIPYKQFSALPRDATYKIQLKTRKENGFMPIGVFDVPGERMETIVFNTNTCHPHQANDGFAAVCPVSNVAFRSD
jgi:aminopeptidase-like protein